MILHPKSVLLGSNTQHLSPWTVTFNHSCNLIHFIHFILRSKHHSSVPKISTVHCFCLSLAYMCTLKQHTNIQGLKYKWSHKSSVLRSESSESNWISLPAMFLIEWNKCFLSPLCPTEKTRLAVKKYLLSASLLCTLEASVINQRSKTKLKC